MLLRFKMTATQRRVIGTATIDEEVFIVMNDHDDHQTMEREIAKLSARQRMRKRAAEHDNTTVTVLLLLLLLLLMMMMMSPVPPDQQVCEVCLIEPKHSVALLPCGQVHCCKRCADEPALSVVFISQYCCHATVLV